MRVLRSFKKLYSLLIHLNKVCYCEEKKKAQIWKFKGNLVSSLPCKDQLVHSMAGTARCSGACLRWLMITGRCLWQETCS